MNKRILLEEAAALRDQAARALRLAVGLPHADHARLAQFGVELRERADELERQAAAETPARPAAPSGLSAGVVLVVEDSPFVRKNALDLVMNAGFEGVGAANADEAIAILEAREDIRLVFTDVEMPSTMDGVRLAHYIRNRWPPIHLIVGSDKAIQEESQLPARARFFPKPYDNDTIVKEMTRMLAAIDAEATREMPTG